MQRYRDSERTESDDICVATEKRDNKEGYKNWNNSGQ